MDFDASKLSPAGLDHRALLLGQYCLSRGLCGLFFTGNISNSSILHDATASWLFGMCWALMALQTYSYYRRYQRDPSVVLCKTSPPKKVVDLTYSFYSWLLKAGVGILFAAETAWTTIIFITAYNQLVDADTSSLPSLLPSELVPSFEISFLQLADFGCALSKGTLLAYAPVASVVTVMCVNVYLISRLYALSKQLWLS